MLAHRKEEECRRLHLHAKVAARPPSRRPLRLWVIEDIGGHDRTDMRGETLRLCGGDQRVRHIKISGRRGGFVKAKDRADPRTCDRCRCNEDIARVKVQEATTRSNANKGLNAKVEQLLNNDGGGWCSHASRLHANWDAVDRAGVPEQAAMIIDELRLLKATIKARRLSKARP